MLRLFHAIPFLHKTCRCLYQHETTHSFARCCTRSFSESMCPNHAEAVKVCSLLQLPILAVRKDSKNYFQLIQGLFIALDTQGGYHHFP